MFKTTYTRTPVDAVDIRVNSSDWSRSHHNHQLARLYGVSGSIYLRTHLTRVRNNIPADYIFLSQSSEVASSDFVLSGLSYSEVLDFVRNPEQLLGGKNPFVCASLSLGGESRTKLRDILYQIRKIVKSQSDGPFFSRG